MKALITSRLRKRFVKTQQCADQPFSEFLKCMLPFGHRGKHAAEVVSGSGRCAAIWPRKEKHVEWEVDV